MWPLTWQASDLLVFIFPFMLFFDGDHFPNLWFLPSQIIKHQKLVTFNIKILYADSSYCFGMAFNSSLKKLYPLLC